MRGEGDLFDPMTKVNFAPCERERSIKRGCENATRMKLPLLCVGHPKSVSLCYSCPVTDIQKGKEYMERVSGSNSSFGPLVAVDC